MAPLLAELADEPPHARFSDLRRSASDESKFGLEVAVDVGLPSDSDIVDKWASVAEARDCTEARLAPRARCGVELYRVRSHWPLVREVLADTLGGVGDDDAECELLWSDKPIPVDLFAKLRPYQRVNHFIGTSSISWKHNLARNLMRMKRTLPDAYSFFPESWVLPDELTDFKRQFTTYQRQRPTFIIKPSNGSKGRGIFLARDLRTAVPTEFPAPVVAQRYIESPCLLDGHKFDLRLYVLVTGCDPLRIFLHREGLVRLATDAYEDPDGDNLTNSLMHLTNYDINAESPNYVENSDPSGGHKRSFQAVLPQMRADYGEEQVENMLSAIEDLVVKTMIAVQPRLAQRYHQYQPCDVDNALCFEVLGFDVMLDSKLKPWIIETNHSPAFHCNTELDMVMKSQVLRDALALVQHIPHAKQRYKCELRRAMQERALGTAGKLGRSLPSATQQEDAARRRTDWENHRLKSSASGFQRLLPAESPEKEQIYREMLYTAAEVFTSLMQQGSNTRKSLVSRRDSDLVSRRDGSSFGARRIPGRRAVSCKQR